MAWLRFKGEIIVYPTLPPLCLLLFLLLCGGMTSFFPPNLQTWANMHRHAPWYGSEPRLSQSRMLLFNARRHVPNHYLCIISQKINHYLHIISQKKMKKIFRYFAFWYLIKSCHQVFRSSKYSKKGVCQQEALSISFNIFNTQVFI